MDETPGTDARAPGRLRALPSWQTSQVAALGARLVADALATEGLRRPHYRVLAALDELGAASQVELGAHVWLDRSDLHGVVVELEDRGLVARERDPADRRRNVVTLTPAGRVTVHRLDTLIDAAQQTLLAPLTAAERRELGGLLARVIEHHDGGRGT